MLGRCALRNGNVHSADAWRDVLDPVIARYAKRDLMRFFRTTPLMPARQFMRGWRRRAISMPSGCPATTSPARRLRIG
jgi:hypothetical protein